MTRKQFELAKIRDQQRDLLAQVEANIYPHEAAKVAGFWLQRQAPEGQRTHA